MISESTLKKIVALQVILIFLILGFWFYQIQPKPEQLPTCGNGVIDENENQITCCLDAGCNKGYHCVNNMCVEIAGSAKSIGYPDLFVDMNRPFKIREGQTADLGMVRLTLIDAEEMRIKLEWPAVTTEHMLTEGTPLIENFVKFEVISRSNDYVMLLATDIARKVEVGKTFILKENNVVSVEDVRIKLDEVANGRASVTIVLDGAVTKKTLSVGGKVQVGEYTLMYVYPGKLGDVFVVEKGGVA
ncbi:MAG: hypothetical protein J7K68_01670 [Candidatus Diapherotrites archaeon]|nr:hypothetical protein [Candidatus Diapherotrites archaeon]